MAHQSDATSDEQTEFTWDAAIAETGKVSVHKLLPADSPRLNGGDIDHVRRLAATDAELPPIIVHRPTMRVIDGMHRLQAAVERRQELIDVRYFAGSDRDAFVLAVQLNIAHGLPLTHVDRTAAASRILAMYPLWSDRLIASIAGLSAGAVRELRRESCVASTVGARLGRDGKLRPIDPVAGRLAASRIVSEHPEASLREIARAAGVSPATVRDVRERLRHGKDPLPPLHRPRAARGGGEIQDRGRAAADRPTNAPPPIKHKRGPAVAAPPEEPNVSTVLNSLSRDPSLRFTESGRKLLRWLTMTSAALSAWSDIAPTVPPHSTYMVADLARQCAAEWLGFAEELTKNTDPNR